MLIVQNIVLVTARSSQLFYCCSHIAVPTDFRKSGVVFPILPLEEKVFLGTGVNSLLALTVIKCRICMFCLSQKKSEGLIRTQQIPPECCCLPDTWHHIPKDGAELCILILVVDFSGGIK
jgi:hypothetical protein